MEKNEVRKKRLDKLQIVLYSEEHSQNLIQELIRKVRSIPIENLRPQKQELIVMIWHLLQLSIQITKTFSL